MTEFTKQKTNSNRLTNKSKKTSQKPSKSLSKNTEEQTSPTKKKRNYEKNCQLLGSINFIAKKAVTRKGDNYGRTYYEINVKNKIENQESLDNIFPKEIKIIYALQDFIRKEKIWKDLETHQWIDKRYLFLCLYHTKKRFFRLCDWAEVPPKPNS